MGLIDHTLKFYPQIRSRRRSRKKGLLVYVDFSWMPVLVIVKNTGKTRVLHRFYDTSYSAMKISPVGLKENQLVLFAGARKQWPLQYDIWWLVVVKVMSNLKKKTLKVQTPCNLSLDVQNRADKNNAEDKCGNGRRFCWLKREYLRVFLAQ